MKYTLAAAGLLFVVNGYAANDNTSSDDSMTPLFKQACEAYCAQYHVSSQSCDVRLNDGTRSSSAPSGDMPARADGDSISLSYSFVCQKE